MKTLMELEGVRKSVRDHVGYIYHEPYRNVRTVLFRPLLVNVFAGLGSSILREAMHEKVDRWSRS